jgi:hypothetical protein
VAVAWFHPPRNFLKPKNPNVPKQKQPGSHLKKQKRKEIPKDNKSNDKEKRLKCY